MEKGPSINKGLNNFLPPEYAPAYGAHAGNRYPGFGVLISQVLIRKKR